MTRLRIAQLAPLFESVPPRAYGGTERVVAHLSEELVARGHEVTLFASGDSRTAGRLVSAVDTALWRHPSFTLEQPFEAMAVDQVYSRAAEFDVIHNHAQWAAWPTARQCPGTPTVTTLHGRLDLPEYPPLFAHFSDMPLVSIANHQRSPLPWANWIATVHHGMPLERVAFQPKAGGYLAFLGRVSPDKGLDTAIRVAVRAGLPLRIGARPPLDQPHNAEAMSDMAYYNEQIKPLLGQPGIEFLGELDDADKITLLSGASALLCPIRWPEPFGLVLIEALACGTPVIALSNGSAPEIIDHGRTGFLAQDEDGLLAALRDLGSIDRSACRRAAEDRFSVQAMTDGYERVYQHLIDARSLPAGYPARQEADVTDRVFEEWLERRPARPSANGDTAVESIADHRRSG